MSAQDPERPFPASADSSDPTLNSPSPPRLQILQTRQVRRVAVFDPSIIKEADPESWRAAWLGMVSDAGEALGLGQAEGDTDTLQQLGTLTH